MPGDLGSLCLSLSFSFLQNGGMGVLTGMCLILFAPHPFVEDLVLKGVEPVSYNPVNLRSKVTGCLSLHPKLREIVSKRKDVKEADSKKQGLRRTS